jgi:hypothetical protein
VGEHSGSIHIPDLGNIFDDQTQGYRQNGIDHGFAGQRVFFLASQIDALENKLRSDP